MKTNLLPWAHRCLTVHSMAFLLSSLNPFLASIHAVTYGSFSNSDFASSDSDVDSDTNLDLDSSDTDSKLDSDPLDSDLPDLDSSDSVSSKGRRTGEGELARRRLGSGSWVEGGASREAPPLGAAWLVRTSGEGSGFGSAVGWILAFFAAGEESDESDDCDRSLVGAAGGGWVYS